MSADLKTREHHEHAAGVVGLTRSLGRLDIIFFTVAATISVDTIAAIAAFGGAESFTWAVVIAVTFLVPYALIMAELGSTFPQEGGPYVWVKLAYGRLAAGISTMLYWVTNPVWLGGSLAFLGAASWDGFISPLAPGSAWDYVFKVAFIWLAILAAIVSIRLGKWFLNIGAVLKLALIAFFVVSVGLYAAEYGFNGYGAGAFSPSLTGFLAVTPILLFAFVGYEAQNGAAEEMRDPQRDVPVSVAVSGTISTLCYLLPIFAILAVLPVNKITGAGGFLDAVATVFTIYGGAGDALLKITAFVFVFTLLNQGAAWMIASDRVQAMAGIDAAFPRYFGQFHPRLQTPLRVNMLSGVVATIFCVVATSIVNGSAADVFTVVLTIAVTTLLISYLFIMPSVWALRTRQPDVERPFRVPGGRAGLGVCVALVYFWVAIGSFVAVFPGVLEGLLGIKYDFEDNWGVSRTTFEVFTLGTLVVVIGIAVGGYLWRLWRDHGHFEPDADVLAEGPVLGESA